MSYLLTSDWLNHHRDIWAHATEQNLKIQRRYWWDSCFSGWRLVAEVPVWTQSHGFNQMLHYFTIRFTNISDNKDKILKRVKGVWLWWPCITYRVKQWVQIQFYWPEYQIQHVEMEKLNPGLSLPHPIPSWIQNCSLKVCATFSQYKVM
jgi:hypothetical protein